ncbi:MAG: hypothetical protein OQJ95_06535 [Kangiella sp.]|nr:hypothetical protein [Kangiella sp.]MCW9029238.1 hypothetical protein [Kangiella sp.]
MTEKQTDFVEYSADDVSQALDDVNHKKWAIVLNGLIETLERQLVESGYDDKTAKQVSVEAVLVVTRYAGGQMLYLPSIKKVKKELRDRQLYEEFNGKNIDELCRKYKLAMPVVYAIIKQQKAMATRKVQQDMFG